jgi:drug/metabolite transporter (DMT)-like permease
VTRRGWLLFSALCVLWGIPYLLIKVAVRELSPASLVFLRTAIGAALLLPVAWWRGELRPLAARWRAVVAFAVAELAVPWVFLADAERRITSSLAGLLIAAVPLVGVVVSAVSGGAERAGGRRGNAVGECHRQRERGQQRDLGGGRGRATHRSLARACMRSR